jgi:divalent metal cation (Fe/Co/Zn/Cd) transporter
MKKALSLFLFFAALLLFLAAINELYTWIFEERGNRHLESVFVCLLFCGFAVKYGLEYSRKKNGKISGN